MVCITKILFSVLMAGAESVAPLHVTMTEEEKAIFAEWYAATLDEDVQEAVLEKLLSDSSSTVPDVLVFVNARHPSNTETLGTIQARFTDAFWGSFVPQWFHDALRAWRGAIDPPSEELVDHLSRMGQMFGPVSFTNRRRLISAIAVWNHFCILPLRFGAPADYCIPRILPVRDRVVFWMSLPPPAITRLLGTRLALIKARDEV